MPNNILTPVGNLRGSLSSGGLIPGVPIVIGSASGNPAHFTDGTNNLLIECIANIDFIREGSGTPAPNNIMNMIGRTTTNISVSPEADPEQGTIYNIDWSNEAGPIMEGYYNAITGILTITHKSIILNKDLNWGMPGQHPIGYSSYRLVSSAIPVEATMKNQGNTSCNMFPSENSSSYTQQSNKMYIYPSTVNQWIFTIENQYADANNQTDLTQWKNFIDTNPLQVVYELKNYIEINIGSRAILSLDGENYIYNESGDIEVKYTANMQTFLQWIYDNLYTP